MLTIAALINAETGLGASGCARGNHACSGSSPALDPNPVRVNRNTAVRVPDERPSACAAMVLKASPPPAADNITRASRIAAKPSWVMTA